MACGGGETRHHTFREVDMKKSAKVVIGANFGDEGKGLITDYFASKTDNGLVIRFNSGPQAGHTVQTPNGTRHVFGHFGSGSILGVPTYLSKYFVVNPILFFKELKDLNEKGVYPTVFVDENCFITLPYDMMINQLVEDLRGDKRHGSCGVGFNESVVRSLEPSVKLEVGDLFNAFRGKNGSLNGFLNHVRRTYVPERLKVLGIEYQSLPQSRKELFESDEIVENFQDDLKRFMDEVYIINGKLVLKKYKEYIFEGAQGLLLDQNHKWFPHVTRSNTGVKNVVEFSQECGIDKLDVTYVTRSYLTRHGAGPLPEELKNLPYPNVEDKTNINNRFQGSLRFAYMNFNLVRFSIGNDIRYIPESLTSNVNVAVTCLDQIDDDVKYYRHGTLKSAPIDCFLDDCQVGGFDIKYTSYGPTRDNIIEK